MPGELTIVGTGMIGTSFALASRPVFDRILALEPDDASAELVLARGIVDARVSEVPATTTAVLLACPSDRIADWVVRLATHPATVFDTGSTKGAIVRELIDRIGRVPVNFVPTHPIAGLERSGPDMADADLFRGRTIIVTPLAATDAERQRQVTGWWQAVGGEVQAMDPDLHDRVYARTSHLPHLLAFTYLLGIGDDDLAHTGGGFRDFSRIGGSDPTMWSAVFDGNRQALLEALDGFEADLAEFRRVIERGDLERCRALIAAARKRRELLD